MNKLNNASYNIHDTQSCSSISNDSINISDWSNSITISHKNSETTITSSNSSLNEIDDSYITTSSIAFQSIKPFTKSDYDLQKTHTYYDIPDVNNLDFIPFTFDLNKHCNDPI